MGPLNPTQWEGVGVGTVVLVLALLHGLAVARGWLVWGPAHRELIGAKDASIGALETREHRHLEIIETLSQTVAEQRVAAGMSEHLLSSIRELAERQT